MAEDSTNSQPWGEQYRRELGAYEACATKLKPLIQDLLAEADIDVVDVESRAKDPASFLRKVEKGKDKYPKPLDDVTDLIGARVIAYYLEDIERIGEIIRREFVVDDRNSMDKLDQLEPDRFGYRSVHYIVSLSPARSELAEWGVFNRKCAEIQLRTATQHAWAAVEHKLSYKRTREAPPDMRRRLTRLSALFELADEQFSDVRGQLERVEARYSDDVRGGNLNLPVDKASLEVFATENALVKDIVKRAEAAGFAVGSPDAPGYQERLDVDLRDLVVVLDQVGIRTIAELESMLRGAEISETIERMGRISVDEQIPWRSPADVLCGLVMVLKNSPEELVTSIYHPDALALFGK